MKNLSLIKESIKVLFESNLIKCLQSNAVGKTVVFIVMAGVLLITSCKKDDDTPAEDFIKAQTSLRLIHSSYISSASAVDLYVDDVKLNTSAAVQFSNPTSYFPLSSGSRKISVKSAGGFVVADTIINIRDGQQYSLFIKDRSSITEGTLAVVVLKTHLVPVVDNSTSAPAAGKAKVRFVNMSSQPLNSTQSPMTYYIVNPAGSPTATTVITQALGGDSRTFGSEYSSFDAGQITFRAQSVSPSIVDLTTTLEAGKLYTIYTVSTEHTVRTPTKSPISLKVLVNN
jgi:hypothetical protein